MSKTFHLPELAESVVEGEIVAWHVAEGDTVTRDQPLVDVMSDKATVEIPSPFAGVLLERLAQEGDVVPVGAPLARYGEAEDGAEAAAEPDSAQASEEDDGDALTLFSASSAVDEGPLPTLRKPEQAAEGGSAQARPEPSAPADGAARGPWGRPLAVPAARRLARELGVPIDEVAGSGPHGRVRPADVRAAASGPATGPGAAQEVSATQEASAAPSYRPGPLRPAAEGPEEEREPLRGLRRAMAEHMEKSHATTVRTLHVDEADMSELVALRARLKPRAEARGVKLTYLPFVLRALTATLARHPRLNALWDEEAKEVVRPREAHLGVAVDTPRGLLVPVVRDASRRTLLDLAFESNRLAAAARDGKVAAEELRGATFSVTNVGALGGLFSFPIIQPPQVAILGLHAIKKRPVVLSDDRIVARSMVYLSLSFDHRLVDGGEAVRFTNDLIDLLEAPESLLLDA